MEVKKMEISFRCGWCGADTETDDYTVVYNRMWEETEYWIRCPNCGEMVRKSADDCIEIIRGDDGDEDTPKTSV